MKIGVIGAGGRGRIARHAHKPNEGMRVIACCDTDPAALAKAREIYGPDVFTTDDYRALLQQNLDAVFITTPDFLHEQHAVSALEAGKTVFLEKPMAITIEGCDRILRTAVEHGRRLYVGHNMRHMDFVLKMKEMVQAGEIGEVKAGWCRHFVAYGGDAYFKDWHAERSKSTSLLLQKGCHDIDVLHWLCGGYSTRVTAMGGLTLYDRVADRHRPDERGDARPNRAHWPPLSQKGLNPIIDVEDLSMMLMQLNNGVFCSYQQCHYTPDSWRNYTIIGSEGRIENFGHHVVRLWNRRVPYQPDGDVEIHCPPPPGGHLGGDPRTVAEFLRYARGEGKMTTSPVAARNSVAAGVCAAESLRNGSAPRDIPSVPSAVVEYFQSHVAEPRFASSQGP